MKKTEQSKINERILDELQFGFSCEKRIHPGWKEFEELKKKGLKEKLSEEISHILKQHFGKWQYIYRSEKGRISLIKITALNFSHPDKDRWVWEMWSEEKLFPDVQRFKTKKEAEKKIREYLC